MGKKWLKRLNMRGMEIMAKTTQGRAISMAKVERKPRTFWGRMPLLIIQKPKMPIPRRAKTDWKMMLKICI